MITVAPYSAVAPIAATTANFPGLKHFWPCNQSDIANKGLVDVINNVTLNAPGITAPAAPDGFSVFPQQAAVGSTITGALTNPTTGCLMLFAVANVSATGGIILGDNTNGAAISMLASNSIKDNTGIVTVSGTAFSTVSQVVGRAFVVNTWNDAVTTAGHGIETFEANTTSTNLDNARVASTNLQAANMAGWGITNKWAAGSAAVLNLYGMAMFIFSSPPPASLISSAVPWMTYQWSKGNKYIYPGLKGIS